ncbi:MAG: hypothetical protein FWC61_01085 [Proteobacteria bacterium]|nr:hypothetical protein [Pseudomonadota bacterium]
MTTCPFFGKCGGCKFDIASPDYRRQKSELLKDLPAHDAPLWLDENNDGRACHAVAKRRRADFSFTDGRIGFFAHRSRDIVPVDACPLLSPALNRTLNQLRKIPLPGSGGILVTECANGTDINITAAAKYYPAGFAAACAATDAIRVTWNDKVVLGREQPFIEFAGIRADYPPNAFLQPSVAGETALRELIGAGLSLNGRQPTGLKTADLFCGLGAFALPFGADGYDNFAPGIQSLRAAGGNALLRDLLKNPLSARELARYRRIILDPPRIGAMAQCRKIARTENCRLCYVSCNPATFLRDAKILGSGGLRLTKLTPVDQFMGSGHWELVGIFSFPAC